MDLSTTYLGLTLKNPLVASASPLTKDLDTVYHLEQAGVSAIVMYSLFEEQIIHESKEIDHFIFRTSDRFAEAQTYFPKFENYNTGPQGYLEEIARIKEAVGIPVIGSLNGVSVGGWLEYAKKIEDAGADAIELNIYYIPNDPSLTSGELEDTYVSVVRDVRSRISIPISVKLNPFITALPNFCQQLVEAGASGLVLFNRFYQPDFNLEDLEVVPNLTLSTSHDLRLPLRWIAMLYGRIQADFAASSGIHGCGDVLKVMMAGANTAMVTSTLLKHGIDHATTILSGMRDWMEEHEYESIQQMRGSMSQKAVAEPAAFERANYMKVLNSFEVEQNYEGMASPSPQMHRTDLSSASDEEDFMSV